jgi:hypothetical protein
MLIETRNRDAQALKEGRGNYDLFREAANINRQLQDEDATVALLKAIEPDQPLAQRCFDLIGPLVVQRGEYALAMRCIKDPQAALERYRQDWERLAQSERQMDPSERAREALTKRYGLRRGVNPLTAGSPPSGASGPPKSANEKFVDQTSLLIEVLIGVGRKAEAEKIQNQALAILDAPRLRSALGDAEARIQQRAGSASRP